MITKQQLLEFITNRAKDYRLGCKKSVKRNDHMNNMSDYKKVHFECYMDQSIIDAILVDFINFIASQEGVDYGLNAEDLENDPPRHLSTEPD